MFSIREALSTDIAAIVELDSIAQQNKQRQAFIEHSVSAGNCFVVETNYQILGYAVLDYSFYEQGFISMLYIQAEYHRRGLGTMLLQHFESLCGTPKLFTSTNLSNLPMQSLLSKSGYTLSGVIHHLDEDDPELVYVKYLNREAA